MVCIEWLLTNRNTFHLYVNQTHNIEHITFQPKLSIYTGGPYVLVFGVQTYLEITGAQSQSINCQSFVPSFPMASLNFWWPF